MGRTCAILGCESGRKADVMKRKKLGLPDKILFKIPKKGNMLEAWSTATGLNLTEKNFICESHFAEESIVREDTTKVPDGTVHSIPRLKCTLVKNAVPIAIADKMILDEAHEDVPGNSAGDNMAISAKSSVGADELCEDGMINFVGDGMDTSINDSTEDPTDNGETDSEDKEPGEMRQFVIDKVFNHLRGATLLPERWSWATNPKDETSVVFIHLHRSTLRPRLRLILHNDFSVTAQTADEKASVKLETMVISIRSLETLLDDMEKTVVCGGSGIDKERRAQECPGIIEAAEYAKAMLIPRCALCRQLRRKLLKHRNRGTTNWRTRYARAKYISQTKTRARKRLREKGKRLQEEII